MQIETLPLGERPEFPALPKGSSKQSPHAPPPEPRAPTWPSPSPNVISRAEPEHALLMSLQQTQHDIVSRITTSGQLSRFDVALADSVSAQRFKQAALSPNQSQSAGGRRSFMALHYGEASFLNAVQRVRKFGSDASKRRIDQILPLPQQALTTGDKIVEARTVLQQLLVAGSEESNDPAAGQQLSDCLKYTASPDVDCRTRAESVRSLAAVIADRPLSAKLTRDLTLRLASAIPDMFNDFGAHHEYTANALLDVLKLHRQMAGEDSRITALMAEIVHKINLHPKVDCDTKARALIEYMRAFMARPAAFSLTDANVVIRHFAQLIRQSDLHQARKHAIVADVWHLLQAKGCIEPPRDASANTIHEKITNFKADPNERAASLLTYLTNRPSGALRAELLALSNKLRSHEPIPLVEGPLRPKRVLEHEGKSAVDYGAMRFTPTLGDAYGQAREYLSNVPELRSILLQLEDGTGSTNHPTILIQSPAPDSDEGNYFRSAAGAEPAAIVWTPAMALKLEESGGQSPALGFAHEAIHAYHCFSDPATFELRCISVIPEYNDLEECATIHLENLAAGALGEGVRHSHRGTDVPADGLCVAPTGASTGPSRENPSSRKREPGIKIFPVETDGAPRQDLLSRAAGTSLAHTLYIYKVSEAWRAEKRQRVSSVPE